jgi:hypothetical protein
MICSDLGNCHQLASALLFIPVASENDQSMRLIAIASAVFAGVTQSLGLGWITERALGGSEPLWLALWGVALIGFSSSLGGRSRTAAEPVGHQVAAGSLDAMQPSAVRSI